MNRLCMVPAKPLARAKARLAPALTEAGRRTLALAMLSDVLAAARECGDVWVVCSDEVVAAAASAAGATAVADETPDEGLNASLAAATEAAERAGYEGVLVLASDVPCIGPGDVEATMGGAPVALAPSADGSGTNALWRSPPNVIPVAFGARSRAAHERLALAAGTHLRLVRRTALALDVDDPDDLVAAVAAGTGPATAAALAAIGWSASRA